MFSQILRCQQCGSLNVSLDAGSNKILCSMCNKTSEGSDSKVQFNDIVDEYEEKTTRRKEENDSNI
jgi:transcription elongation factor Elf1